MVDVLPSQGDLRIQVEAAGAPHQATIVECHEALAACAASPVQGVGKVEPAAMQADRIFHRFPALDGHVRHAEQMVDGPAEGLERKYTILCLSFNINTC